MTRAQAWAESVRTAVLSRPPPVPVTRPFTPAELEIDPDTLSFYVAKLSDTSYYSIGGCSDVQTMFWGASETLGHMGPGVVPALVGNIDDPDPFVRERVQDALLFATQDERILIRTGGDYIKFYDQPSTPASEVVKTWWAKYRRFWVSADTTKTDDR